MHRLSIRDLQYFTLIFSLIIAVICKIHFKNLYFISLGAYQ